MAIYKREDNRMFKMSQQFIDGLLLSCPFCETSEPNWLVGHETVFMNRYSFFKCSKCGAIIKIRDSDISGEATIKYTLSGIIKLMEKKSLKVIYANIKDIGNVCTKNDLLNSEIDIKILYDITNQIKEKNL